MRFGCAKRRTTLFIINKNMCTSVCTLVFIFNICAVWVHFIFFQIPAFQFWFEEHPTNEKQRIEKIELHYSKRKWYWARNDIHIMNETQQPPHTTGYYRSGNEFETKLFFSNHSISPHKREKFQNSTKKLKK